MKSNYKSSFIPSKNIENDSFSHGKYNEELKELKSQTNNDKQILTQINITINSESSHVEYHGSSTNVITNHFYNQELNENNFSISDNALYDNLLNDNDDADKDEKINDFDKNNYRTNFNFKKNTIYKKFSKK